MRSVYTPAVHSKRCSTGFQPVCFAVAALFFSVARGGEWVEFGPAPIIDPVDGPYSGRISAMVASPTNANRFFAAGASGGVWRTSDGGTSWTPLTDQLPSTVIGALAMDPSNENVLYAGSGEANYANHSLYGLGIYKTLDGGETWTVLGASTFSGRTFARIVVSQENPSVVFSAIGSAGGFPALTAAKGHPQQSGSLGVFRSLDGGANWTHLTNGLPAVAATDLVIDPTDADTLYAAIGNIFGNTGNGVYKTVNGGDSWVKLMGGLPSGMGRISLGLAPSQPQRLYALYTRVSTSTGGNASTENVYRTDNGGTTWTPTNPGNFQATYGWYLSTVFVSPSDPNTFFVGGLSLLRSVNGGTLYQNVTPPHVDMHALAFDANGALLCGGDGGVHRSMDNGDSWIALNNGLSVVQFYPGLSVHPTNPDFVLAGAQDNGTNRREIGLQWSHKVGGDGGYTAMHPSSPMVMFAEYQGSGNLFRSIDGGDNFSFSGNGISLSDRNCFLPPVTYSPSDNMTLLYGTHRIYRSTNNGLNWTAISADLTAGSPAAIRSLGIAPSNAQTVYAGTNDGRVLVSVNGGVNFALKLTGIPGWVRVKREIAVDPLNDSIAYLAVAQFGVDQVRMTTNRGDTWVAIDGDLPDVPVNTVAVQADGMASTVFVGTDAGVYMTCNAGAQWRKMGTNLPNVPVMDLIVDDAHKRLVAGTLGRGVWVIPVPRGDTDDNAQVDMFDYSEFHRCITGSIGEPGFVPVDASCLDDLDFDLDNDIDLEDYNCFMGRHVGP